MSLTVENLRERVNAGEDEIPALQAALDVSEALVDQRLAKAWRAVPEAVRDLCVLIVADEIYTGSKPQQNNATGVGTDGVSAVRTTRDPLAPALPLIKRYVSAV